MVEIFEIGPVKIYQGDVMECLRLMPDESVHCVITSPPYYGLRRYIDDNSPEKHFEIGLEKTLNEYLDKMVEVFREVRRVMRSDATCWVNMGDSYASGKGTCFNPGGGSDSLGQERKESGAHPLDRGNKSTLGKQGLKPKDLMMVPARLAIRLCDDGWWLRSEICWTKGNPMPESTRDRPTSSHEKIYLLSKNPRYFYDREATLEPYKESSIIRLEQPNFQNQTGGPKDSKDGNRSHRKVLENIRYNHAFRSQFKGSPTDKRNQDGKVLGPMNEGMGRNMRNVWEINVEPGDGIHYATFPTEIPRRAILAGTSEKGVCGKCGAPWKRIIERTGHINNRKSAHAPNSGPTKTSSTGWAPLTRATNGWEATCSCDASTIPATILDCFAGSGTTLQVACELNRRSIGIELNPDYFELIKVRIAKEANQEKMF